MLAKLCFIYLATPKKSILIFCNFFDESYIRHNEENRNSIDFQIIKLGCLVYYGFQWYLERYFALFGGISNIPLETIEFFSV